MVQIKINNRSCTIEKLYDKIYILFIYLGDTCSEWILCLFRGDFTTIETQFKIALLFKWASFWNLFTKNENNYIDITKKTDTSLAWNNYIFPKTRASKSKKYRSGPITQPLSKQAEQMHQYTMI